MQVIAEQELLPLILRRTDSLFARDVAANQDAVAVQIRGGRVVVSGAAGSIGSAFVKLLARFRPAGLTLIDLDENGLVELVRDIRSGRDAFDGELKTLAIGLGSVEFEHFVRETDPISHLVNFAALKHVRAERDPHTLMRLLDTNVLALERAIAVLSAKGTPRLFSVSSDKAVRPASLMGASKRWMERVLASHSDRSVVGSARFANVAFSRGSLLEGFLNRIAKRQPIAAPKGIARYFISAHEAAELCLLACFVGGDREVFVPRFAERLAAIELVEVARIVLRAHGLEPELCSSAEAARTSDLLRLPHPKRWPCYFSEASTSGEKALEEFVGPNERLEPKRFEAIDVLVLDPPASDGPRLEDALRRLIALQSSLTWRKPEIVEIVRIAVPDLTHVERGASLDDQM
jgi:FlaA1/EpsC-like NDP-sugar epimerase